MRKSNRKTKVGAETSIQCGRLFFAESEQCRVDSELFKEIIGDKYTNSIRVISLDREWYQNVWLDHDTRLKETINIEMTIRAETRHGKKVWYAYRRVLGVLYKRYVGASDDMSQQKILETALKMPSA